MTRGNLKFVVLPVLSVAFASTALATGPGISSEGPDVTVLYLAQGGTDINEYYDSASQTRGYAFGTTSCNRGTETLEWYDYNGGPSPGDEHHPVIAQQMFRLHDGVFEQLGMAWLKHGFCAVNEPGCGSCQSTNCDTLGLGCADTYWAGLNESGLKPRRPVNPSSGVFPFPEPQNPVGPSSIRGLVQVPNAKVGLPSNEAQYFIEGLYIASDDHAAGNDWNNASWREVNASNPSSLFSIGATVECEPAVFAWSANDSTVKVVRQNVNGDGWINLAYTAKEIDGEPGIWRYDYVVQNTNSHRGVRAFSVPIGENVEVTDVYFIRPNYHSGEPMSNTPWSWSIVDGVLTWEGEVYTGGNADSSNNLYWGNMFSMGFRANSGPEFQPATVELFRPSAGDSSFEKTVRAPMALQGGGCPLPNSGGACPECDLNQNGTTEGLDIGIIQNSLNFGQLAENAQEPCADVCGGPTGGPDGVVNGLDVACCQNSLCFGL